MAGTTIRGRTLAGDQTQSSVRVLALDPSLERCMASTQSDEAGGYALEITEALDDVVLLARFRGPSFGAVHRRLANRPTEDADLVLDDEVSLELEFTGEVPDTVLVTLLPDVIPGWTEPAASDWTYLLDGKRNESFAVWEASVPLARLAVQPGTWRLLAWQREGRAREVASSARSWYVSHAELVDGEELEVAATGIELEVTVPLRVRLHLAVVASQ
jgi:hypothetical protein